MDMDISLEDLEVALRRIAVEDGAEIATDSEMADLVRAVRAPVKPGPRGSFRLGIRRRLAYEPTIYIFENGKPVKSTGIVPTKAEEKNPYLSLPARVRMQIYIMSRSRGAGKSVQLAKVPVGDALDEMLEVRKKRRRKRRPRGRKEASVQELRAAHARYLTGVVKQLKEFFDKDPKRMTIGDIDDDTGWDYVDFRCERQIKSQSAEKKDSEKRCPTEGTARSHLTVCRSLLKDWCKKHRKKGHVTAEFDIPAQIKAPPVWATWDQMARLALAIAKGLKFNEDTSFRYRTVTAPDGTVTTELDKEPPEVVEEFKPLQRVLPIGVYAGCRARNGTSLTWGFDDMFGCLDPKRGRLHGDGRGAVITRKGRNDRGMLPPLNRRALVWEQEDAEEGHAYPVHDADGRRMSLYQLLRLFKRAAANAGISWMVLRDLKATGATMLTYAGLPPAMLSVAFSTTTQTLQNRYIHLEHIWNGPPHEYRPENLEPAALRRFSPVSRARVELFAAKQRKADAR